MKKTKLSIAVVLFVQLSSVAVAFPQNGATDRTGTLSTMHALDPIGALLSLRDGAPGHVFQDHIVKNRDSHISFHVYAKDSFQVGIQGGDRGVIIDLGSDAALQSRYGYADTVGNGQGFASIHIEQGRILIGKDYETGEYQPLKEFDELSKARKDANVSHVVLGHIYLVRIDSPDKEPLYAKLKVVAFVPGESVTIRWLRL